MMSLDYVEGTGPVVRVGIVGAINATDEDVENYARDMVPGLGYLVEDWNKARGEHVLTFERDE